MRHTRIIPLCLAVLLFLAVGAVRAEEIVYFTNGNAMPVRSHEVRGTMIHVDLGSDSFMAFPLSMVEKVEVAGKGIVLDPSFSGGNKLVSSGGNYPVRGRVPSRYSDSKNKLPSQIAEEDPEVEYDGKMGVAVHRPFQGSRQVGKRQLGAAGNQRAMGSGERVGGRRVIGSKGPPGRGGGKPPLLSAKLKSATDAPPPEPQEDADSGSAD